MRERFTPLWVVVAASLGLACAGRDPPAREARSRPSRVATEAMHTPPALLPWPEPTPRERASAVVAAETAPTQPAEP